MPYTYKCFTCGKSFEYRQHARSEHMFCSQKCYFESRKTGHELTCERCGKKFYRTTTRVKRGERFCSRTCYDADRNPKTITKICPICAKSFTVNASVANRYTVCSQKCRLSVAIRLACERCGKTFRGDKRYPRHYCSEKCRRPPVYKICKNCGINFRIQPGTTFRQFCSFVCYRRFHGETTPERLTREALVNLGTPFIQEAKMGRYSIDFLLTDKRVAIEIDGIYWHRDMVKDARKTRYLNNLGWHVLRITDLEISHIQDLGSFIINSLKCITRHQSPDINPSLF